MLNKNYQGQSRLSFLHFGLTVLKESSVHLILIYLFPEEAGGASPKEKNLNDFTCTETHSAFEGLFAFLKDGLRKVSLFGTAALCSCSTQPDGEVVLA